MLLVHYIWRSPHDTTFCRIRRNKLRASCWNIDFNQTSNSINKQGYTSNLIKRKLLWYSLHATQQLTILNRVILYLNGFIKTLEKKTYALSNKIKVSSSSSILLLPCFLIDQFSMSPGSCKLFRFSKTHSPPFSKSMLYW